MITGQAACNRAYSRYIGWSRRRRDNDLAFTIRVRLAIAITINVILTLRVGRVQQIHWIAHLCECVCTFLGLFLARWDVRDAHKRPFVAEALDRLKGQTVPGP